MPDDEKPNGRNLTEATTNKSESETLERQDTIITIGKLKLRGQSDDLPQCVFGNRC